MHGTVKQNNQSDLKVFFELTNHIADKKKPFFCCQKQDGWTEGRREGRTDGRIICCGLNLVLVQNS